mmetsp:Transcript_43082/g.48170  ORF Transcript_43082/g.48170 Transcript_43082/m.48170 type:complete len:141 (-) Transcript_43082:308-730(-)
MKIKNLSSSSSSIMMVTTAIVLGRLDPILKSILEKLTELKNLLPHLILGTSRALSKDEENFVRLINEIVVELQSLSKAMIPQLKQQKSSLLIDDDNNNNTNTNNKTDSIRHNCINNTSRLQQQLQQQPQHQRRRNEWQKQ